MSNTVLTPQVLANELLRRYKNNLGFAKVAHHEDYRQHFAKPGGKIGDTLNLREPVKLTATDGPTLVIQDVEERKIPLVINERKLTAFQFDSAEMTLSVDYVGPRYIESAAVALSNAVEVSGLKMAYQNTPNVVGTPGTIPGASDTTTLTAFKLYLSAGEALERNSCPEDGERYMVISPKFTTYIVDQLKGLFQSTEQIKRQYIKGRMGTAAGFDWLQAQNIRTHTLGAITGGSPQVNGSGQSGSWLSIKNVTASSPIFLAGDVITLGTAGTSIYALNQVSGDTLSDLRQFVVLQDAVSDGNSLVSANIYPPIAVTSDPSKPNPYATCSASPTDGTAVTLFGTANTLSPQSMAFHREAFAWACVPMVLPQAVEMARRATDPDTGMSARQITVYDGVNDLFFTRCEVLYGWVAPRRDWACRIAG